MSDYVSISIYLALGAYGLLGCWAGRPVAIPEVMEVRVAEGKQREELQTGKQINKRQTNMPSRSAL